MLAWMQERFPGLKPDTDPYLTAWEFFCNAESEHYLTDEGNAVYLVEVVTKMFDKTDSQ